MFKIPNYTGAGIYAILNIDNKHVYIGQSSNIRKRAITHYKAIMSENHANEPLRNDSKLGKNFAFIVLERISDEKSLHHSEYLYMMVFMRRGFTLYNSESQDRVEEIIIRTIYFAKEAQLDEVLKESFNARLFQIRQYCTWNLENVLACK